MIPPRVGGADRDEPQTARTVAAGLATFLVVVAGVVLPVGTVVAIVVGVTVGVGAYLRTTGRTADQEGTDT